MPGFPIPDSQFAQNKLRILRPLADANASSRLHRHIVGRRRQAKDDPFIRLRKIIDDQENEIISYLQNIDPTLIDSGTKTIERVHQTISNFEHRVLKAREARESLLTDHLEQIYNAFFPEDSQQERYLGILYFLNKFGPEFIALLFQDLDVRTFDHQVTFL